MSQKVFFLLSFVSLALFCLSHKQKNKQKKNKKQNKQKCTDIDKCDRPASKLILYEYEGCPFCRIVRETLCVLDLDAIVNIFPLLFYFFCLLCHCCVCVHVFCVCCTFFFVCVFFFVTKYECVCMCFFVSQRYIHALVKHLKNMVLQLVESIAFKPNN